jgi:cysteine synthase A
MSDRLYQEYVMTPLKVNHITGLIGNTPVVRVNSLSRLTGCEILVKCENMNPGGSIKDRAALQMITDAVDSGALKPGMTIVEGTAGNTGIGLALVGRSLGYAILVVMPNGQAFEKERLVSFYGAELKLVDPCPFSNPNHFYHTARRIAEQDPRTYWWANQFDNLSNYKAHFRGTGPEIYQQTGGFLDYFVSVSGTGGTIAGVSSYLKEKIPDIKIILADPEGSGSCSFFHTGKYANQGSSITEGIGIMRLVENFKLARIDDAFTLGDQDSVTVAYYVKKHDNIVVGSSSALNLAGALKVAAEAGPGKRVLTMLCDGGDRAFSKLYNPEFLASKGLNPDDLDIERLLEQYRQGVGHEQKSELSMVN